MAAILNFADFPNFPNLLERPIWLIQLYYIYHCYISYDNSNANVLLNNYKWPKSYHSTPLGLTDNIRKIVNRIFVK